MSAMDTIRYELSYASSWYPIAKDRLQVGMHIRMFNGSEPVVALEDHNPLWEVTSLCPFKVVSTTDARVR